MDWLLASIDPGRIHDVGSAVAWHGRAMTLAWAVLAPLAVLVARYFKVLPGQDWPRELDNLVWWRSHWIGQGLVVLLSLVGLALIYGRSAPLGWHGTLGYTLLGLMAVQVAMGLFRGSKGGPTAPDGVGSLRGDHYDMTSWRVMFEWAHKSVGYGMLLVAVAVVVLGLWEANAPRWMWLVIVLWWMLLAVSAAYLQRQGRAVDTYQAIWGPDPIHPGNTRKPIGWGIRRLGPEEGKVPGE
ncbi:MAG: cytochrome b561 domain-containing protein [Pseudomonadota bacterium]